MIDKINDELKKLQFIDMRYAVRSINDVIIKVYRETFHAISYPPQNELEFEVKDFPQSDGSIKVCIYPNNLYAFIILAGLDKAPAFNIPKFGHYHGVGTKYSFLPKRRHQDRKDQFTLESPIGTRLDVSFSIQLS